MLKVLSDTDTTTPLQKLLREALKTIVQGRSSATVNVDPAVAGNSSIAGIQWMVSHLEGTRQVSGLAGHQAGYWRCRDDQGDREMWSLEWFKM
jgi:hypothetical protein